MKWKILFTLLIICSTFCSYANNSKKKNHNSEFEIAIGGVSGFKDDYGALPRAGMQILLEYRYNLPDNNISLGTQWSYGYFERLDYNINRVSTIYNKGCTVTYVDYNFRIKERLSFFIGMGIGFAAIDYEYPKWVSVDTYTQEYAFSRSAVLSPRVGVEFFKRLRLTIEYRLMRKDYSCFGINLGFSIGGR